MTLSELRSPTVGADATPFPAHRPFCLPVLDRVVGGLRHRTVGREGIIELAQADPALAALVVREARSAIGEIGGRVMDAPAAFELLGRARLLDRLEKVPERIGDRATRRRHLAHLRHVIVVSLCAEKLAELLGEVRPATARLAGLLAPPWPDQLERRPGVEDREASRAIHVLERRRIPGLGPLTSGEISSIGCLVDLAVGMAPRHGAPAAGPTRFGTDEDTLLALQEASAMVQDRIERHVEDGLLVLGTLLGIEHLTADGLIASFEALHEARDRRLETQSAVVPELRDALDRLRHARHETAALGIVRDALLDLPQAGAVFTVLDGRGEDVFLRQETRPLAFSTEDVPGSAARVRGESTDLSSLRAKLGADGVEVFPIEIGERPLGEFVVQFEGCFDPALRASCQTLVSALTARLTEIQLDATPFLAQDRMRRDTLTGVLTRGALTERLAAEVHRASRAGTPLSVIMVDVDLFKEWNDRHGHQVGDEVLASIGQLLAGATRDTDAVGRYGGDEFLIILPGRQLDDAERVRDRIARRVAELGDNLAEDHAEPRLGLSLGVAAIEDGDCDAATLLFRADHALYQVKRARRSRRS